jgi:hypothetical protein
MEFTEIGSSGDRVKCGVVRLSRGEKVASNEHEVSISEEKFLTAKSAKKSRKGREERRRKSENAQSAENNPLSAQRKAAKVAKKTSNPTLLPGEIGLKLVSSVANALHRLRSKAFIYWQLETRHF